MSETYVKLTVVDKNNRTDDEILIYSDINKTIQDLKNLIYRSFRLPNERQLWIYKDHACDDVDTLESRKLCANKDNFMFLYLLSDDEVARKKAGQPLEVYLVNFTGVKRPVIFPEPKNIGWVCPLCTFINLPLRPGCEQCATDRPADYKPPTNYVMSTEESNLQQQADLNEKLLKEADEREKKRQIKERNANYQEHLLLEDRSLIGNRQPFECDICLSDIERNEGITLRECFHNICRNCLKGWITNADDPEIQCPIEGCEKVLQYREIKGALSPEELAQYDALTIRVAEARCKNAFHCKTVDCLGWVEYHDNVNDFLCEVCKKTNCITCGAIHEGMTCKQYQDELKLKAENDQNAKKDLDALKMLVTNGEAMHCPGCQVIIMKKIGCDWIQCTMCKMEICWATKGPRWGPKGRGDTSGGCKCNFFGKRCHPKCGNCH